MVTLTFTKDLDTINVHHDTKFGYLNTNGSQDMNYCPVFFVLSLTDRSTDRKQGI